MKKAQSIWVFPIAKPCLALTEMWEVTWWLINLQVWHYCDLNGGQASFLCPNGTIFSQVALTCDWWFNVKCASTTQLYVLNERLYKYILPHKPSFPEDYSGPLVDHYLNLKFKEIEEKVSKTSMFKCMSSKSVRSCFKQTMNRTYVLHISSFKIYLYT